MFKNCSVGQFLWLHASNVARQGEKERGTVKWPWVIAVCKSSCFDLLCCPDVFLGRFWDQDSGSQVAPSMSNFCAASSLHVSNLWLKRLGFISSRWVGKGHSSFNLVLGLPFQVLAWICLVSCKVIDMFPSPRCDLVGQCHKNSLLWSLCALFGIYCDIVYILFSLLIVLGAMLGGLNNTAYSL